VFQEGTILCSLNGAWILGRSGGFLDGIQAFRADQTVGMPQEGRPIQTSSSMGIVQTLPFEVEQDALKRPRVKYSQSGSKGALSNEDIPGSEQAAELLQLH
jgi:hypothetical protein